MQVQFFTLSCVAYRICNISHKEQFLQIFWIKKNKARNEPK